MGRLKTGKTNVINKLRLFLNIKQKIEGTPPRIDGKTIDFSKTERKYPDYPPIPFSFMNDKVWIDSDKQLFTHMTYTNEEVAKIVKDTLHLNRHVREETKGPR